LKKALKRYWPYLVEYKFQFFLVLIGIIFTVSATAATAYIMQPMMDRMFIERDEQMLIYIPAGLIAIYLFKSGGRYIQSVSTAFIGLGIVTTLRSEVLEKILSLDMSYLYANRSGELISRITNDINRIQYFVSLMLPEMLREILTVIALIGYVIYLNAALAFYALIVLPVVIVPLIMIAQRLKKLSRRSQEKNADIVNRLSEVFNNAEIIKLNATEKFEQKRFDDENRRFLRINMKTVYTSDIAGPLMEIIGAAGLAAVIFMGGQEVYSEKMTVGEFTAFLTAVGLVFQPIRKIGTIYAKMQDAIAASERMFEIRDLENSVVDGDVELNGPITSIKFDDVSLCYDEKIALKNITLDIHANQTIALVGDSGGGKSSVINAIVRFYDVSKGELMINGKPVKSYTKHSLRDSIAVVSQRVYIFQDTLAANVAYGHDMDEKRIIEALKMADALEFAEQLEDGIYTKMEEFGANLSGGQRQRIAIARAIYKKASVLILDEATSALDSKSEKRIQETLMEYTRDKITIIIAHRLSTIEHADIILVFKDGRIVDSGSHQELLETSTEYQRLCKH